MATFGKKMREARHDKNLSQVELAKLLHVKRRTVSSWETGVNEPSIEMIKRISKALERDIKYFFDTDVYNP